MNKIRYYLLSVCFVFIPISATSAELVNCFPSTGVGSSDNPGRGFYVESFPGFTLDQVYLFFESTSMGEASYTLTARSDNFGGGVLGVAEASYEFSGNSEPVPVLFDFQRVAVSSGQRVTFEIDQLSGPNSFYSTESTSGCPIIQTENTNPPLSEFRRDGITAIILGSDVALTPSVASLENPADVSSISGISLISGWVCDAERVEVEIDGTIVVEAAYGTPRADTMGECGDIDNGFGLLVNYGVLGEGVHSIRLLADGLEVGSAVFNVTTLGAPFVSGLSGTFILPGFPGDGQQSTIRWLQSVQGFVITDVSP